MKAILRIGASNELVIVEDRKLLFIFGLRPGSILTDAYKHLANLNITELKLIITPVVRAKDGITSDYELSKFIIDGRERSCFVSKTDIERVKELASVLKVNNFLVYNSFDVFKLIGKRQPTIICGKYIKDFTYYIYVDSDGIRDFRSSKEPTLEKLEQLSDFYGVENVLSERNNVLNGLVRGSYDNIMEMDDDELSQVYISMCAEIIKPCMSIKVSENANIEEINLDDDTINEHFKVSPKVEEETISDFMDEDFIEDEGDFEDTMEFTREVSEEIEPSERPVKGRGVKKASKNKTKRKPTKAKILSRLLDIIGCFLVILLSLSIIANKEVPNDIEYIGEKIVQTEAVLEPKRENVEYITNYVEALTDGKNTDNNIVQGISAIPVDGILAEIALEKKNVGIAVYLSDETAIDKFTEELNKIVDVNKAEKVTVLELDSDPLHKFVVSATIK